MIGIVKSKTLKNGTVGEFWKITKLSADLITGQMSVTLSLYINQAAFASGKSPLTSSKVYNLTITPSDLVGDLRTMIWTKIKAKANSLVTVDISGALLDPAVPFDPDLVGGTDV